MRIRGYALPDGEVVDLYADGDRWTTDPVADAELAGEGWLLPGLVDAHTHPGAEKPGDAMDGKLLRADLRDHVAAGVTFIRSPGLADDPPGWFGEDADVPRAVHAGNGSRSMASSSTAGPDEPTTRTCRHWPQHRLPGPGGQS